MTDDKLTPHSSGDYVGPTTDVGPNTTPGITTETAAHAPQQNKWTADHIGNIPVPADPEALIPPTPRADPEHDHEMAARETQPMKAKDVNKSEADKADGSDQNHPQG